jgi:hypothetical protein
MRVGALVALVLALVGAGITALAIVGVLLLLDRLERRS